MVIEHFRKGALPTSLIVAMAAGALLAACAAPQQIAALDDQKCQAEGLKAGSKKYDRCRAALESDRKLSASGAKQP